MNTSVIALLAQRNRAIDILKRVAAGRPGTKTAATRLLASIDAWQRERQDERTAKEQRRVQRAQRIHKAGYEPAPKHELGVVRSADGLVLARKGQVRLIWQRGGTYFSCIGRRNYAPAELELYDGVDRSGRSLTRHFDGGGRARLSRALIEAHSEAIDAAFGRGVAAQVAKLEGTVVVNMKGKKPC